MFDTDRTRMAVEGALKRSLVARCGLDVDALSDEQVETIHAAYIKRHQAVIRLARFVTRAQFSRYRTR